MKKKWTILCVALVIALTSAFCGCSMVRGGKMKQIKGTYQMTGYYRNYESEKIPEDGVQRINFIERDGITCYLVIDGSSVGKMVYKSNSEPLTVYYVDLTYRYNTEDSSLIDHVKFDSGFYPASDSQSNSPKHRENMGVFATRSDVNLNVTHFGGYYYPQGEWIPKKSFTDDIDFKKVSKATDLSYVQDKLGELPEAVNMSVVRHDNIWGISGREGYVYCYYDIDAYAKKADLYYALEADRTPQVRRDIPVTFNEGGSTSLTDFVVDGFTVTPSSETYANISVDGQSLGFWAYGDINIEEKIAEDLANYNLANPLPTPDNNDGETAE